MGLDYNLFLEAGVSPDPLQDSGLGDDDLQPSVRTMSSQEQSRWHERIGFLPSTILAWKVRSSLRDVDLTTIFRTMARLLKRHAGRSMLLFNHEVVVADGHDSAKAVQVHSDWGNFAQILEEEGVPADVSTSAGRLP